MNADLDPTDTSICINSPHTLQRRLLADYLSENTDLHCIETLSLGTLANSEMPDHKNIVVLWDCSNNLSPSELAKSLHVNFEKRVLSVAFNVSRSNTDSTSFIDQGLHGLFFEDEPPCQIAKGIRHIVDGELWFSRSILSNVVREKIRTSSTPFIEDPDLTCREKEILFELSKGSSNQEIATKFFLSIFTVKTHIRNIYKKIGVSRRSQALRWAYDHYTLLSSDRY